MVDVIDGSNDNLLPELNTFDEDFHAEFSTACW
jgi:hypothetical protein